MTVAEGKRIRRDACRQQVEQAFNAPMDFGLAVNRLLKRHKGHGEARGWWAGYGFTLKKAMPEES